MGKYDKYCWPTTLCLKLQGRLIVNNGEHDVDGDLTWYQNFQTSKWLLRGTRKTSYCATKSSKVKVAILESRALIPSGDGVLCAEGSE